MAEKKASSTKKKPSTSRRSVATKAASTKKTSVVAKKPTQKKKPSKPASSNAKIQSFKKCPETQPFMTFKITQQTVYWLVICVFVFALGAWILKVQYDVMSLYN